jgi:hypothetical protein
MERSARAVVHRYLGVVFDTLNDWAPPAVARFAAGGAGRLRAKAANA